MPRPKKNTGSNYLERIETEVTSNQSRLSLVLGALIVLVVGILVFNYFNKNSQEVGPANQTEEQQGDVSPQNLPGKYTVKEGDTLFTIAESYYGDGNKYTEIVKANNLSNENVIEEGQVLEIPKVEGTAPSPMVYESPMTEVSPSPTMSPSETPSPTPLSSPEIIQAPTEPNMVPEGEKGATAPTPISYGPAITGDSYTVVEGDWLSTIAARAYNGDILAYQKLAVANNIPNPDLILPGQVLKIPR